MQSDDKIGVPDVYADGTWMVQFIFKFKYSKWEQSTTKFPQYFSAFYLLTICRDVSHDLNFRLSICQLISYNVAGILLLGKIQRWTGKYDYIFVYKVNTWNVNCAQTTSTVFDSRMDVLENMSEVFETENVSNQGGTWTPNYRNRTEYSTIWVTRAIHFLSHVWNIDSCGIYNCVHRCIYMMHIYVYKYIHKLFILYVCVSAGCPWTRPYRPMAGKFYRLFSPGKQLWYKNDSGHFFRWCNYHEQNTLTSLHHFNLVTSERLRGFTWYFVATPQGLIHWLWDNCVIARVPVTTMGYSRKIDKGSLLTTPFDRECGMDR